MDIRRATRGQPAGEQPDAVQQRADDPVGRRIGDRQPIENRRDKTRGAHAAGDADEHAEADRRQRFTENHSDHAARQCTERHADPDLFRATSHRVGHGTVKPDADERESEAT